MRRKVPLIATGLLVVGAFFVVLRERNVQEKGEDARIGRGLLDAQEEIHISGIQLSKGQETLKLVRDADGLWHTADDQKVVVDAQKVVRLLDDLARSRFAQVATNKPEKFSDFGLSEPAATLVLSAGDKEVIHLKLGDLRQRGGQYAAVNGEDRAFLIDPAIGIAVDADGWEHKSIVDIAKDQIKSVAFFPADAREHGQSVTLERDKKGDSLTALGLGDSKSPKAAAASADSLLSEVIYSKRWDIGNESAKAALASPSKVFVTLFDGRTLEVQTGAIDGKHFVKIVVDRNGASLDAKAEKQTQTLVDLMARFAFEVPAHIAERFVKGSADFVEDRPAPLQESTGEGAAPAGPEVVPSGSNEGALDHSSRSPVKASAGAGDVPKDKTAEDSKG